MEFFDTHAHYNDERFEQDREEILENIYQADITKVICAGYNIPSSKKAIKIAEEHDFIYAITGISPNDVTNQENLTNEIEEIRKLAHQKKVVGIGEIGLDYYWNKENKELQKEYFVRQIELANELQLPIVIHSRDAFQDTINVLKQNLPQKRGVFHCIQLNQELVREALKLDFYISFAGPITFKNAKNVEEIVEMVPLERILIETDSPYLSPEPNRGKRNDSSNVKHIAERIKKIKQITLPRIAEITYQNAEKVFQI